MISYACQCDDHDFTKLYDTFGLTYDITVNPHINTILQTNDFNVSIPNCAGERSLAEARSGIRCWRGAESCGLKSGSLGWRVPYTRPCNGNISKGKVGDDA